MTLQDADATTPGSTSPLASWLLPSTAMFAAVAGFAVIAGYFLIAAPTDSDATAPDLPSIGAVMGASLAHGTQSTASVKSNREPASSVPGFEPQFDPLQEPFRLVADASAG